MTQQNSNKALVKRSSVEPTKDYTMYREFLRHDFWYTCAYCFITEAEANAISFEIDHYFPQKHFPHLASDYSNLLYSCRICNSNKGSFYPNDLDDKLGNIILRPDKHDPRDHLKLNGIRLDALTHTGQFNIRIMRLNNLRMRRLRELRERLSYANDIIAFGLIQLSTMSIDRFKGTYRLKILALRDKILGRKLEIDQCADEIIREKCKSPFVDPDPDKDQQLKDLKAFMKSQRAITGEQFSRGSRKKGSKRK